MSEKLAAEFLGPYKLEQAPSSMVRFALGSAVTIASCLVLPDAIGIMPDAASFSSWSVRVVGLWLSAYILWTAGFTWMLYSMRLLSGGIQLREDGLKLWRFGKVVPWKSIKALICEPQPFFRRAFCLPGNVYRLTFYQEKIGRDKKKSLAPQNIPSFQFSSAQFESLFVYLSQRCFDVTPSDFNALLSMPEERVELKKTYERGRLMRIAVSVFIMLSLVTFLGRRSAANYAFNSATHQFRMEHYPDAQRDYALATKIDPMFPPAWDRLARSEFRQGKFEDAEKHWHRALQLKPDFVEPKIGLSLICMNNKDYAKAKELLQSSLRLSPSNIAAYLNLAQLNLLTDHADEAHSILNVLLQKDPQNAKAHAMLAESYLKEGDLAKARVAIIGGNLNLPDVSLADAKYFRTVDQQIRHAEDSKRQTASNTARESSHE